MLLALSACNKVETEIQPVSGEEGITITATLAPKGANTKAVADGGDKITVTWAVNEHIAILYTKDGNQVADATITAVDGSGAATISFTVVEGTADDTPCTLVYPLSAAKDDHTGVKDAATLLAAQDGTLNANLDVRVGEGTIQTTTPGLTVTTQPEPQYAIFKFTTKNSDGSATINVTSLTVTIGAQDYVITPASATSELFAALPAISGEAVTFTATGSDSKTYTASKASVTFAAGKYYQSNIKMTKATVLSGALVDGAIIKVNFKWRGDNYGDYVQGVYNAASGTFTASKGGSYWGDDERAVYKVEKSGDNIIIGAGFYDYGNEGMVWTFNTTNDTYTTTNGQWIDSDYGLISVTLNGTDITSQLMAQ